MGCDVLGSLVPLWAVGRDAVGVGGGGGVVRAAGPTHTCARQLRVGVGGAVRYAHGCVKFWLGRAGLRWVAGPCGT